MAINVKNTTFPTLLDLIAPHSCRGCGAIGKPLCDRCKNYILKTRRGQFCPNCKHLLQSPSTRHPKSQQRPSFLKYKPSKYLPRECPHCHLPFAYVVGEREDLLATLIHDYKYDSTRALAEPLAELLDAILPQLPKDTVIVPLPTIAKHVRMRGLDHTALLASKLAKLRGYQVEHLLVRQRSTVQVGSSRKARIKQASQAYQLSTTTLDPSRTYLLLDDVWTTGASMKSAVELFRKHKAHHVGIALLATSE